MKDVMIDLETLGKGENALIIQIGAVYFDPSTGERGTSFFMNIDPVSAAQHGGQMDPDTVRWWLTQSKEAQNTLLTKPQEFLFAMAELKTFLSGAERVWSHATFDFVIIQKALENAGLTRLPYKSGLDIRTLVYLAKVSTSDFPRDGVHHNGLDDALYQVKYTSAAFQKLRGDKTLVNRLKAIISP